MANNKHELKIATFADGTYVVLRTDPANPRLMEVIATFYDVEHAQDYVRFQSAPPEEHQEEKRRIVKHVVEHRPRRASAAKPRHTSRAEAGPKLASAAKPKRAAEAQAGPAPQAKPETAATGLSERQAAVLLALRSLMNKKSRVEVRAAELAKTSSVPLGSLHSILASLEKKQLIRTERRGSPKFSAIYEVLETSRKSTRLLNGVVRGQAEQARATG